VIIKGKARARARQLAAHILRRDQNERVSVREVKGTIAQDVRGALEEMEALASGMRTTKALYHAVISPAVDRRLTPEQMTLAIDRLEESMGFSGNPRVVVVHEKKGREHIHVVWSRVDLEKRRAIPDSWNYMRHEQVARDLEREFGHERVQGALAERDGRERPKRTPTLAETRQAERAGFDKDAVTAELTELWQTSETGREFRLSVEYAGYLLAQGDRRSFVIIDPAGEVHALARRIEGVKTKDVKAKLRDVTLDSLPSVAAARALMKQRATQLREEIAKTQAAPAPGHDRADPLRRRSQAVPPELLFSMAREKLDAHLAATLYSSPDYVSMTTDARRHIADRARVKADHENSLAGKHWIDRASKPAARSAGRDRQQNPRGRDGPGRGGGRDR